MRVVLDLVSVLLPVVLSLSLSPATTAVADEDLCGDARRCENGGVCVLADPASVVNATTEEDHRAAAKKRCLCPGGWTGSTCEEELPCDLDCGRHGGVCAFPSGLPATATIGDDVFVADEAAAVVAKPFCRCPEGRSGRDCRHENRVCPDGLLVCLNGSDCRPHPDRSSGQTKEDRWGGSDAPDYACDCTVIDDVAPYAGVQCEHMSARNCAISENSKHSFCVNGGRCKRTTNDRVHHGCNCPKGWAGDHCEFAHFHEHHSTETKTTTTAPSSEEENVEQVEEGSPLQSVKEETRTDVESRFSRGGKMAVTFGSATLVAVFAITCFRRKQRSSQIQNRITSISVGDGDVEIPAAGKNII